MINRGCGPTTIMLYKEFKQTDAFKTADMVDLYWDRTGKEIPDAIPDAELDELEVVHTSSTGGFLSITLKRDRKVTITDGSNTFELVDLFPLGYQAWNIGKAPAGCIPFCRVIPGTCNVEVDTLKAVQVDGAEKVMKAVRFGCNTIEKMEKFVKRHQHAPEDSWEYRHIQRIKEALPILKSIPMY